MTDKEFEDISYEEGIKRHRRNRHEKLLRQAAAVLAGTGISHMSMDKLAKEMGVSKVILYRYFKSKDELIDLILETFVDRILISDARDIWWGRKLLTDNLNIIRENQDAFLLMMRHARHDSKFGRHYQRFYSDLVDHTVKRLSGDYKVEANRTIGLKFFAERICSFLLDSVSGWVQADDPDNDQAFVRWLVYSVSALAETWGGPTRSA